MLAALALTACSQGSDSPPPGETDFETAYLTLRITQPTKASNRASGENVGTAGESVISRLYVLTFDSNKQVVKHASQTSAVYIMSGGFTTTSGVTTSDDPIKISPNTNYLLIIANAGAQMQARLSSLSVGSTWAEFNRTITVPDPGTGLDSYDALVGEIRAAGNTNFTMINAGDLNQADCLIDVSANVKPASDYSGQADPNQAASDAAKAAPAVLRLERLAAKVGLAVDPAIVVEGSSESTTPGVGQFRFDGWEFDYRNSMFFPYALKTEIDAGHTSGIYADNFYTVDPNFTQAGTPTFTTGIYKNTIDPTTRAPRVTWNAVDTYDYCIENTLAADDQYMEAATRLVIKGAYSPMEQWTLGADWFSFGTWNFQTLAIVKARYTEALSGGSDPYPEFVTACNNFLAAVNTAGGFTLTDFMDLDQVTHLDQIPNGGEISKIPNCLLWYDGGINYYTYVIRHDNSSEADMYYGKYGVVRNNWYQLNLNEVSGKGTPWIPEEGPGPIDEGNAYLSFTITVGPWIYWTNNIGI